MTAAIRPLEKQLEVSEYAKEQANSDVVYNEAEEKAMTRKVLWKLDL